MVNVILVTEGIRLIRPSTQITCDGEMGWLFLKRKVKWDKALKNFVSASKGDSHKLSLHDTEMRPVEARLSTNLIHSCFRSLLTWNYRIETFCVRLQLRHITTSEHLMISARFAPTGSFWSCRTVLLASHGTERGLQVEPASIAVAGGGGGTQSVKPKR